MKHPLGSLTYNLGGAATISIREGPMAFLAPASPAPPGLLSQGTEGPRLEPQSVNSTEKGFPVRCEESLGTRPCSLWHALAHAGSPALKASC